MATNEELAIAFLCLATRQQQSDLIQFVSEKYPQWISSENGHIFLDAINLPFTEVPKKISKLGVALYSFDHKNAVYLWMADECAALCAGARSPFPIPMSRHKDSITNDPFEHIMILDISPPATSK